MTENLRGDFYDSHCTVYIVRLSMTGVGAQSTLGGTPFMAEKYVWKINKMPEFYVILAWKINKIP